MKDYITAVGGLVINKNNEKILLVRGNKFKDFYVVPEGKPEPKDKTLENTVLRELNEEIGLEKKHIHFVKHFFSKYATDFIVGKAQLETFVIICHDSFKVKLDKRELSEFEWFNPKQALEKDDKKEIKIEKYTRKLIEKYLSSYSYLKV